MKKIITLLNDIVESSNNDPKVMQSAADLLNCLDKKYNKKPKKHNKIELLTINKTIYERKN